MKRQWSAVVIAVSVVAALSTSGCSKAAKKAQTLARAQQSLEAGQYDKAKIDYLSILRLDPGNATAFIRLGQMWFDEGVPVRAAPFLLRARDLVPKDFENRLRLAHCYLALGRTGEARDEALSVLRESPDDGEALTLLTQSVASPDDVQVAEQSIQSFPKKEIADHYVATANLALYKKDFAAARKALDQAVAVEPKSVSAHLARGVLHVLQNELSSADAQFKMAAELASVRAPARIRYAEFLLNTGRREEASALLVDMTKQAPDSLAAWTLLARISFLQKEYDKALTTLENVFSRDGDNLEGRLLQGETLLAKEETAKANETLEHLSKIYPNVAQVKYQLARAYLQSKDLPKANDILDQVVRANPDFTDAVLLWARINLQAGRPAAVISALEPVLKKRPKFLPAQLVLADAYRAAGRLDDAVGIAREVIQLSPNSAQVYGFLGTVQQQQDKTEEARQSYEKAAELSPNDPGPENALLGLDLLEKRYDLAARRVQKQLQRNPNSAVAHYMKARIDAAQKNWDAAESALGKAMELDSSLTQAYDLLLSVYLANGKLPAAINQLEEALKKNPQDAKALLLVAMTYEKANNYVKAQEAYERLLVLRPDSVPALNNLAYLHSEHLNDSGKAFELAKKAHELQPENPSVADTLGWIVYKRGDYQQALSLFEEGVARLPENPELQFHLGMTRYMMGQTDSARSAFQRATRATADFPGRAEARRRLDLLDGNSATAKVISTEELEKLAQQQPDDVVVLTRLGKTYEQEGLPEKAAAAYESALRVNPNLLVATLQLAKLYAGSLHAPEKAFALAKSARALAPADIDASFLVAQLAYDTGNYAWAYDLLRSIVRQRATDPNILCSLGWAAYALGDVGEARAAMQKALEAKPLLPQAEDAKTFLAMTGAADSRESSGPTEAEIQKALQSKPDYVPALMRKAALEAKRKQPATAVEIYQKVLGLYPDFAPAKKQLAAFYSDDPGQLDKAYELAVSARKAFPGDLELACLIGKIDYQRKDYNAAIQLLEESGRGRSLDSTGLYYLGMAHVAAGNSAQGLEILQRALVAGLPDSISVRAKETVAELERNH